MKRLYYQSFRKRDFAFMETGIPKSKEHEYLVAGKLELDKSRLVIRRPDILIGSDRLDFYDFFGRRRESLSLQNRNWLKFCLALTFAHFLLVRVPSLFSQYFGDEVDGVSSSLGAQDKSEAAARIQRMKQA